MDAGDIGCYGTLSLLKRLDPHTTVASYPIDDAEVTIGRDPSCSIRLYYPAVSALHCKIIFSDNKKAFLVVLGTNGVLVDGCPVFPSPENQRPAMVPLPNDSMIDIHKKRFQFAYPPKHLRPAFATPLPSPTASYIPERRRALRMSMIHSAHVFSPRPSADPSANLRVLQSPLKAPFARERKDEEEQDGQEEEGEKEAIEEEDIVLVESDHPRVVEEGKDLVILEHVTVAAVDMSPSAVRSRTFSPARTQQMPVPPQLWAPPRTPARRPPRSSLHRAVLIRSAQRAALRQEMQREEEEMEVEEVEVSIVGDEDTGAITGEGAFEGMEDVQEGDEEFEEEVVEVRKHEGRRTPMSGWRKSLEAVKGGLGWAFRAASVEAETKPSDEAETIPSEDTQDEHDETEYANENEMDHDNDGGQDTQQQYDYQEQSEEGPQEPSHEHQNTQPDVTQSDLSLAPRPLGRFMTPQGASKRPARASVHVRYSMGGFAPGGLGLSSSVSGASGPRRVRVVEPWKVTDLVVPLSGSGIKEEDQDVSEDIGKVEDGEKSLATPTKRERERASEEERRAIRERRKSALTTPDMFFNGQVPGSRRTSLLPPAPALPALFSGTSVATTVGAASNPFSVSTRENEDALSTPVKREDGPEDTQVLLARMRQMVEGVKRRQSVEAGAESPWRTARSVSPKKRRGFSLLAWEQSEEQGEDVGMIEVIQEEQAMDDGQDIADEQMEADAHEQPPKTPRVEFSRHLPASAAPATPNFAGMRDMFKENPTTSAQTPRMDGVREMFFRERGSKGMEESALEGVGEMLATPAGWRGKPAPENIAGTEEDEADDEDEGPAQEAAASKPSHVAKAKVPSSSIGLRRTPRSAVQKGAPESNLATVQEDGAAPESRASTDRKGARVVRRGRTRTAESDQESTSIPRLTRTRKAMSEEPAGAQQLPSRTKSVARRKAGTDVSEDEAPTTTTKTARRTRQASGSTSTTVDDTITTTGAKNPRRTRATRTPASEEQPGVAVTKSSAGRRVAKTKVVEAIDLDNEEDPLDSIDAEEAVPAVTAAKVKRTARSRIPVGRVKEEEEEDSPQLSTTDNTNSALAVARGKKAAAGITKSTTTAGSTGKSTARTRAGTSAQKLTDDSSGKTTADEQNTGFGDKENTPESQGEDEPVVTKGKTAAASKAPMATRAKGTRSATKAAARANTEELNPVVETEAAAPDGGKVVSRSGRTRAAGVRR